MLVLILFDILCLFNERRQAPFRDGSAPVVGAFVTVPNSEGDGNPAPVGLPISTGRTLRYRSACLRTSTFILVSLFVGHFSVVWKRGHYVDLLNGDVFPYGIRTHNRGKRLVTPIHPCNRPL